MAKYSNGYEERLKREIRDAMAVDPIATLPALTETLNRRLNHSFDPRYIKRLRDKVSRQLIVESDRLLIEQRMRFTRENYRISREALLNIINPPEGERKAAPQARVEAAKALVMLDLALFKAELETGMFKKPVDEMAKAFQYEPLDAEVRAVVVAAWQRGGLLPKATIERMIPEPAHP
jgi:hypothetical protein